MSSARNLLRAIVLVGFSIGLIAPGSVVQAAPSVSELTQQINKASVELERIVESYNRLNEEIKATKATAAEVSKRIEPLEQQLAEARAEVGRLAVTAYKNGRLRTADVLLDPASADNLAGRLGALDQLARDREQRISALNQAQHRYTAEKARLDTTLAKQTAQAKQLTNGKKKIEADLARLYQLRRQAYGSATTKGTTYQGTIPAVSGQAGVAVRYAYGAIGKPYVWAADGPNGYDCSGLTKAAWRAAGKSLPHNAAMQWDRVARISRSALQPGDLVFYNKLGHVALYVGSGKVIHAPTFGESVKLASVDMMTPYGYGRVR
ncbi:NlpC/P60 family protein [Micromonospora sp. NPDC003197]